MTDMADHAMAEAIRLSRNETESLCMKSARGAGFSWGLAEEAGFACGWLAARGIDGTGALLALLTGRLDQPQTSGTPVSAPGQWRCTGEGPLCPITLGAALLDRARLTDGPFAHETRLSAVGWPILLLPFLVRGAEICGHALRIAAKDDDLLIASDGTFDRSAAVIWAKRNALPMTIRPDATTESRPVEPCGLPLVSSAVLSGLNGLALRTTVPASAVSRQGAGSVMSDND